jgi:hypothetical protein
MPYMDATLIIRDRRILTDGAIIEVVVWWVPAPVPPTTHGLKYRLFYGKDSQRIVGFDNERGKGDHKHIRLYQPKTEIPLIILKTTDRIGMSAERKTYVQRASRGSFEDQDRIRHGRGIS